MKRVLCIGLFLTQAGCVVPFALPPTQLQLGGSGRSMPERGDAAFNLRAGVHPMQVGRGWMKRRHDLGAGYLLDAGSRNTLHGAYLEAAVIPTSGWISKNTLGRVLIRGQGRVMVESDRFVVGRGAALQLTGELTKFVNGPFEGKDNKGSTFGWGYGEGGAGLYLEGAYTKLGDIDVWTFGGGLTFRLPAAFGVWIGIP